MAIKTCDRAENPANGGGLNQSAKTRQEKRRTLDETWPRTLWLSVGAF